MFISHFNRYLEKHAKITYFVLLLIIIATFVIFVTPGDVLGNGDGRVTDYGTMYGKKLRVDQMNKEMNRTIIATWLLYPNTFGQDLSSIQNQIFHETLNRMRILRAAKKMGFSKVEDSAVIEKYTTTPAFQDNGAFSKTAFDNFLNYINRAMGLAPAELDQIVRDNIAIERTLNSIKDGVTVTDDEVLAALAEFKLKCATFDLKADDGKPTEEEIQKFFADRKADIVLPATKNAQVARFDFKAIEALAQKDAALAKTLTVTADECRKYFDTNAATLYKGKKFEDVSAQISKTLRDNKVRAEARKRASELSDAFRAPVQGESAEARQARFVAKATQAGATIAATGLLSTGNVIAGMEGPQPALAAAIRRQENVGDVTNMVYGNTYTAVAYITEKKATPLPAALPAIEAGKPQDDIRSLISDTIVKEKAMAFFNAQIKAPYEAYAAEVKKLDEDKKLDDRTRRSRKMLLLQTLNTELILSFYEPEARDFGLVTFSPDSYKSQVPEITDAQITAAYEARKAEFQKIEVRLGRIVVSTKGLEGEALTAKETRINDAKKALDGGADFAATAAKFSEETTHEDKALTDLEALPAAVKAAVSALQKGQISQVIDVDDTKQIVKVIERRDGRTLAQVRDELKTQLANAAARKLADDAAAKLAQELNEKWWKESETNSDLNAADLLKSMAEKYKEASYQFCNKVALQRSQLPYEVLIKVAGANLKAPVTGCVIGSNASYVAALTGIYEAHIIDPANDTFRMRELNRLYAQDVQMKAAQARAQAASQKISVALQAKPEDFAAAAGDIKFVDLPVVELNKIYDSQTAAAKEISSKQNIALSSLAVQLNQVTTAGVFLTPVPAERNLSFGPSRQSMRIPLGYQLIYVAGRTLPAATEANQEVRNTTKERLLSTKQQTALQNFLTELEAESNTKIREGLGMEL